MIVIILKLFKFATNIEFETKGEYFNMKDERVDEYKLSFCEVCFQMTNHLNGECQKHKNKIKR